MKLIEDYNRSLTNNEEQKQLVQLVLQVINDYI